MVDEIRINKKIINKTRNYAKKIYDKTEFVHGWDHICFVVEHAKYIAKKEGMNIQIAEMGALLHDISQADMSIKDLLVKNHAIPSAKKSKKFLKSLKLDKKTINHILDTIKYHSSDVHKAKTKEALAVYDGDKLDAVGPRGFIRVLCSDTRYEHPKDKIDELYKLTAAEGKRMLTQVRTKTGRRLARKYFDYTGEFMKGYEKIKKGKVNG